MKTERNILIAFLLNLSFSVFEFIGGALTGSVAIISDAIHDMGDAASIGFSYIMERKSRNKPDDTYTYGYVRYSVLGSVITTVILLSGSVMVIYNAIKRLFSPVVINYNGMIILAIFGVILNLIATYVTRKGESMNQKAINLHMLEDVLGWIVVLIGAVIMRFADIAFIDPIMSICVALFIFISAFKNLKDILDLFLEKIPIGISVSDIREHICRIDGVLDVHHIHIRSVDGQSNAATMHIVTDADAHTIKELVREELAEHGIAHATLELEGSTEQCHAPQHIIERKATMHHHHHH